MCVRERMWVSPDGKNARKETQRHRDKQGVIYVLSGQEGLKSKLPQILIEQVWIGMLTVCSKGLQQTT